MSRSMGLKIMFNCGWVIVQMYKTFYNADTEYDFVSRTKLHLMLSVKTNQGETEQSPGAP